MTPTRIKTKPQHRAHRRRLSPEQRVPQILDAALAEFSAKGFVNTRMDDIACHCDLSKGGVYAHFESKESILEALVERSLQRFHDGEESRPDAGASSRELAEWLVDRLHAVLLTSESIAILRLLIPERERVPERVQQWKRNILRLRAGQVSDCLKNMLVTCGRQGSVLIEHPWLALSPVMHVQLWQAMFGLGDAPDPNYREAHINMLCELLDCPAKRDRGAV